MFVHCLLLGLLQVLLLLRLPLLLVLLKDLVANSSVSGHNNEPKKTLAEMPPCCVVSWRVAFQEDVECLCICDGVSSTTMFSPSLLHQNIKVRAIFDVVQSRQGQERVNPNLRDGFGRPA